MTKDLQKGFLFPSRNIRRINREGENGGTHYTIFGYRHRCAKIVSEPKGVKPPLDSPIAGIGSLAGNEGKIQNMEI